MMAMAKQNSLTVLVSFLAGMAWCCQAETITGYIYCDNHFEFYFNGVLVKADPLDFTPHNAVKVSFEYDGTSTKTYAIMCQDYASSSGYEYTSTNSPQLGDGALLAEFSDGTRTSTAWKVYTVTYGPTDASIAAGCSSSNLGACAVQDNGMPTDWTLGTFDDSSWTAGTVYTTAAAGWGRTPSYSGGQCGTITSPLTKQNDNPSSKATTADECLDPKQVLCNGGSTCTGADEGRMIWGASLEKDNKMLFRYTVAATAAATTTMAADTAATTTTMATDTAATTTMMATDTAATTTMATDTAATTTATADTAATSATATSATSATATSSAERGIFASLGVCAVIAVVSV